MSQKSNLNSMLSLSERLRLERLQAIKQKAQYKSVLVVVNKEINQLETTIATDRIIAAAMDKVESYAASNKRPRKGLGRTKGRSRQSDLF